MNCNLGHEPASHLALLAIKPDGQPRLLGGRADLCNVQRGCVCAHSTIVYPQVGQALTGDLVACPAYAELISFIYSGEVDSKSRNCCAHALQLGPPRELLQYSAGWYPRHICEARSLVNRHHSKCFSRSRVHALMWQSCNAWLSCWCPANGERTRTDKLRLSRASNKH